MNPYSKRLLLTLLLLCGLTAASAQHHFDAQAFEAEKQTYIVQQAHLTPEETRRFVPLYKEMVAKKRKIHGNCASCASSRRTTIVRHAPSSSAATTSRSACDRWSATTTCGC